MILQSHTPSTLANLTSLLSPAKQATEPDEQPAVREQEEEVEKDEAGFLRPELRGEVRGNQVECLGCSTEGKKIFRCGILWNWNRHVQLKHNKNVAQPAASAGTSKSKPASISGASKCRSIQPKSGLGVDTAENGPRKGRKTKSELGVDPAESEPRKGRKIGGPQKASTATASKRKAAAPPVLHTTLVLPAQPAAQLHHVPQASDDSVANIFLFAQAQLPMVEMLITCSVKRDFARLCRPLIPIASDPRQRLSTLKSDILILHSRKQVPLMQPLVLQFFQRRIMLLKCFHRRTIDFSV